LTGFNSLNLTNVSVEGLQKLKAGIHRVVVNAAEYKVNSSNTGRVVVVKFEGLETVGTQQVSFNVQHESARCEEIGRQRFKTFLAAAGHPNPNKPGDIRSLNGLRLKLAVEQNGTYQGSDGNDYPSYEPAKRGAFLPLERTAPIQSQNNQGGFQHSQEFQQPQPQQQQPQQQQPIYGQPQQQNNGGYDGFPT